jgi:hypothetical protein
VFPLLTLFTKAAPFLTASAAGPAAAFVAICADNACVAFLSKAPLIF